MRRSDLDLIGHGLLGGVLAGAVAAAWFFTVDLANDQAFHTPARLASIILGEEFTGPWPRLVFFYSTLHFGVFAAVGLASVFLLKAMRIEPGLVVGAVFGIGVLNAVHYAGLLITGTNLLTIVPVVHVFVANLLSGMVLMAYLHRALRAESPLGWSALKAYPVLYHGLLTGLVGAAAVAYWLFLVDLVAGHPFYAPATLGSAILLGASSPNEVQFNLGVIAGYSILHVSAFVLVGIAFSWLAKDRAHPTRFWLRTAVTFVLIEALFLGTLVIVSGWVIQDLGWFTILAANALAVVCMGLWLWRTQRDLPAPSLPGAASVRA